MGLASAATAPELVSCILPTKNRAAFIPQAIKSFQDQTYPAKELIVLDNGTDITEALIPTDPAIKYAKVTGNKTVGEMRNLCVKMAQGKVICHFDSDDWSHPDRVTDQVTRLGTFGVVTGYSEMLFYDVRNERTYLWRLPQSPARMVLGTSLCYTREWWSKHPFEPRQIGEDIRFFKVALKEAHRMVSLTPAKKMMVARVHQQQTCRKSLRPTSYLPMAMTALPEEFPRVV
jgi:glycosyltransferase involved in cell wall biosynthesis